jgi:transcriptional regulator with XRE-family HTH domain
MLRLQLHSPAEVQRKVAGRARLRRLERAWTQAELAGRSGTSLATLRRFERTGQASFATIIAIAFALSAEEEFLALFPPSPAQSIDDVLEKPRRQRGRRR